MYELSRYPTVGISRNIECTNSHDIRLWEYQGTYNVRTLSISDCGNIKEHRMYELSRYPTEGISRNIECTNSHDIRLWEYQGTYNVGTLTISDCGNIKEHNYNVRTLTTFTNPQMTIELHVKGVRNCCRLQLI